MQIIEGESSPKSQGPNPSFTKKFFAVVCIGLSASGTNVIVAKSIDKLFNHFFYKTCVAIMDYFIKIALLATTISLPVIFCNTFLIIGYCLIYLEEIAGGPHPHRIRENRQFLEGTGLDDDDDTVNLEDNTLIDFIRVVWQKKYTRRIALFFVANLGFMFVEVLYGYLTNSLGLISDAVHMAFDCLALLVGLIASYLAQSGNKEGYSYGMSRIEVLSGFFNGVFLIFIAFKVLCESVDRIYEPQMIEENGLLMVSVLGLVVNIIGLSCFHDLHHHDHGSCGGDHGHSHEHHDHGHEHHDHSHEHHDHHNCSHEHDEHDKLHSHGHDHSHEHKRSHSHEHKSDEHHGCSHEHKHDHSHDHKHEKEHKHSHDHSHSKCSGHGHDHEHKHDHKHEHKHEHKHSHEAHSHTHSSSCSHGPSHSHDHDTEHNAHSHDSHGHGHGHNENVYGFFLHILADALGSVGVIISSLLIKYKGLYIADPICSAIISVFIFISVIPLIMSSGSTLLLKHPNEDRYNESKFYWKFLKKC